MKLIITNMDTDTVIYKDWSFNLDLFVQINKFIIEDDEYNIIDRKFDITNNILYIYISQQGSI